MRRREFITLLGSTAAAWPSAARGQQRPLPVIGYMNPGSPEVLAFQVSAFRKGLSEAGYQEGRNVAIEFRWGNGETDRLPEMARELVRLQVAAIVAGGNAAALAAKATAATIPIVFTSGGDPVADGLVASLNRPGGNITGVTGLSAELAGKQLGLLHELVPDGMRFAVLFNPSNPSIESSSVADVKAAAAALGLQIEIIPVANSRAIDAAFASLAQKRAAGLLIVAADPLFLARRVQLATLAVRHAVPAIFSFREGTDAGGLMSYGPSIADMNRQVGVYAGRILKGEKPPDLPVMRASKLEFVVNLQTARTIDLTIPPGLLALADEVIE
jgi:putative ABC transport system substrate-binding protein